MFKKQELPKGSEALYRHFVQTAEVCKQAAEIYERKGFSKCSAFFRNREKDYAQQAVLCQKEYKLDKIEGSLFLVDESDYQVHISIFADFIIMAEKAKKDAARHESNGLHVLSKFFKNEETELLRKAEEYKKEHNLNLP